MILGMVISLQFAVPGVFAQENDGSIERFRAWDAALDQKISRIADAFEQIESDLGREKVAEYFVELALSSQREGLSKLKIGLERLSEGDAGAVLEKMEGIYSDFGLTNLQRQLRNLNRSTRDVRERLGIIISKVSEGGQKDAILTLLAGHSGSVSRALRVQALALRDSHNLGALFPFTRGWFEFVDDSTREKVFYENVFWSIFVLPLALTGDFLLFPFQALYWIGYGIADVFTTSPNEKAARDNELVKEINRLRGKIGDLESQLQQKQDQGTIRR